MAAAAIAAVSASEFCFADEPKQSVHGADMNHVYAVPRQLTFWMVPLFSICRCSSASITLPTARDTLDEAERDRISRRMAERIPMTTFSFPGPLQARLWVPTFDVSERAPEDPDRFPQLLRRGIDHHL
jgi:hypothetical protein